jgi:NADPH-dependent curcumin reductase CurA
MVDVSCFGLRDGVIPEPGPEQALLRVLCVAIDPAIRGWLNERGSGYLPPLAIGEPVRSNGVGIVVKTTTEALPVGALVTTLTGWQEWALACSDFSDIAKLGTVIPPGVSPVEAVTVHVQIATTSYVGIEVVAKPQAGETMVISAAASAVGSLVGQMARRRGALVIGIVGREEKRLVTDSPAEVHQLPHRRHRPSPWAAPKASTSSSTTWGEILDTVLRRMALHGRVIRAARSPPPT